MSAGFGGNDVRHNRRNGLESEMKSNSSKEREKTTKDRLIFASRFCDALLHANETLYLSSPPQTNKQLRLTR